MVGEREREREREREKLIEAADVSSFEQDGTKRDG